jgi:hypothetical protein
LIPLTKTLDPADYIELKPIIDAIVEPNFTREREQNNHRRWEYAMAITAYDRWNQLDSAAMGTLVDVGGAGSPFKHMMPVTVIDPDEPGSMDLSELTQLNATVFCISTIEHVEDLDGFVNDLARVTLPGGLLFLTMDAWSKPASEPDTACGKESRRQIFGPDRWRGLADTLGSLGFSLLGDADWTYHGDQLYSSYTFASLAMVKR